MMDVRKMASMGQKAMREKQSKAEKIFWALFAGRSRQSAPRLIEAVNLGRSAANKLWDDMKGSGLRPQDAGCSLVCASHNDKVNIAEYKAAADRTSEDAADIEMALRIVKHRPQLEPIGIAFVIMDREKGNLLARVRPFEKSERSERLLETVIQTIEQNMKTLNEKGPAGVSAN